MLFINTTLIVSIIIIFDAMTAAKILFLELTIVVSFAALALVFWQKSLYNELLYLESEAEQLRMDAIGSLASARAGIEKIKLLLYNDSQTQENDLTQQLFKNVMPIVGLYINKEKNFLRWGMLAWKLAGNAVKIFKRQKGA